MQKDVSKVILPATVRMLLWLLNMMTAKSTSSSFRSALAIALCSQSADASGHRKSPGYRFRSSRRMHSAQEGQGKLQGKLNCEFPFMRVKRWSSSSCSAFEKHQMVLSLMLRVPKPSCEGFGAERSQVYLPFVLSISISDDFVPSRSV